MKGKDCLDCQHCYIEDLYHEVVCEKHGYIGDLHTKEKAKNCENYERKQQMKTGEFESLKGLADVITTMPRQVLCTFREDGRIRKCAIDLDRNDHILVSFEKGFVVVSNGKETKFVCKEKDFISLWN